MGIKRRFQLWSARKQGKAYKTPAAAPTLEFRTLELMTDRKKMMLDNLNCEVRAYLNSLRYKSEVQPELSCQVGARILGQLFQRCGSDLPEDSNYGNTLLKGGLIMCRIGEIQNDADQVIRERFLRPIIKMLEEDLRHFDYERRQLDDRRTEFELAQSRWEHKRHDVDLETKMITARNRYEGSLRTLQDLMLRINMREQEEIEALRCFFVAQMYAFREAASVIEQSLEALVNPHVRADPLHRPLAELPETVRPRIGTVSQLAPYQMELPPQAPALFWGTSAREAPMPLGYVPQGDRYYVPQQQQQQQQQQTQQQQQPLQQSQTDVNRIYQQSLLGRTTRFELPEKHKLSTVEPLGGRPYSPYYHSEQTQQTQQQNLQASGSFPYIAVRTGDQFAGDVKQQPREYGYSGVGASYMEPQSAHDQMLSSQYQPLSGTAPRVRSERSGTPQLQESPIRSPDDDPSRWATHEAKMMRATSSYEVPNQDIKVVPGDTVNVTARSNDGKWVFAEVNDRKVTLPAHIVNAA